MRIAHVTTTFPPNYSGTGIVCYHNALELARRGHKLTVYSVAETSDKVSCGINDPPELTVCRLPALVKFGNAPVLLGLLALKNFDVIHLHFPFYFGAELVALAAYRHKIPLVVTYHQDALLKGIPSIVAAIHDRTLGALSLCSAQIILFTTLDYGHASKFNWLFKSRNLIVDELPNGVDTARFHPALSGNAIRQLYTTATDEVLLLMVAALDQAHYFKGIAVLLEALAALKDRPIRLVIVGEGNLRNTYEAKAVELGLADKVSFAGHVEADLLPAYYAAADIGLLPSTTMGEAFGMVLLEAMACGKPVIASNLPGVRTVVSDGVDGLLAEPGNVRDLAEKITILAGDKQQRQMMGQRGRAKVEEKYTLGSIAERLETYYLTAISHKTNNHLTAVPERSFETR
ncbi:MAG: glycosyltransferase family 4 protein [Chloroflexota bacterium]